MIYSPDKFREQYVISDCGCWEFIGGRTGAGYGAIWLGNGISKGAHVVSYIMHCGNVPEGLFVCHTCDTPWCVNPEHLFIGTLQDNKADEISKDRNAYGERCGTAKLKESDVIYIRQLLANGWSYADIGRMYNITRQAVYRINAGLTWSRLQ